MIGMHELPTGTWVDLSDVSIIEPVEFVAPYVRIVCGVGVVAVPFSTLEVAKIWAGAFAALVNERKASDAAERRGK